ncbi:MAG: hypothetical protein ACI9ZF_002278 [Bradyrhizobium sp.]|jgi:hypothetical protein
MTSRAMSTTGKRWLMAGLLACAVLAGLVAVAVPLITTQPVINAATPPPAKPDAKSIEPDTRPRWNELTPGQQSALAPLAADWNKIEVFRKKKWLEIGNHYGNMNTEEQSRTQERMREWAKLTPDERRVAREIYTRTKKLDANTKSAQWQEYQQLPEEQKKKLAESTPAKKRVSNLPALSPGSKPASVPKHYEKAVAEKPASMHSPAAEVSPLAVPPPPAPQTAPTQ